MRVVLYTEDFEPITVIDLPEFAAQYLEMYGRVSLSVPTKPMCIPCYSKIVPMEDVGIMRVDITAEKIRFHNNEHLMLFTKSEEAALLLKSSFLPGQRSELQEAEKKAFANGFMDALTRMRDL